MELEQFFTWATDTKGYDMTQIAAMLGYSERHLYRIRKGEITNLVNFQARAINQFGDEVRGFFLPPVSLISHNVTI